MSLTTTKGTVHTWGSGFNGWGDDMDLDLRRFDSWACAAWSNKIASTTGLTYGYHGGPVFTAGAYSMISDSTLAMTDNATNYVERTLAGTVSKNTSSFSVGSLPMAKVTTVSGAITLIEDWRNVAEAVAATPAYGDNDTSIATTAFVQGALGTYIDDGNSGTTKTIDWSAGNIHKLALTGNCTLTYTAPTAPVNGVLVLKVTQGSGPYTLTWPAAVHWASGTAPTLTATNAKVDLFTFIYLDSTYYPVVSGQNYTA